MNLDLEVRRKSQDIDDVVLMDAIKAVGRRVRVFNRNYDIFYIAGYSKDGHFVFIDRDLSKSQLSGSSVSGRALPVDA